MSIQTRGGRLAHETNPDCDCGLFKTKAPGGRAQMKSVLSYSTRNVTRHANASEAAPVLQGTTSTTRLAHTNAACVFV